MMTDLDNRQWPQRYKRDPERERKSITSRRAPAPHDARDGGDGLDACAGTGYTGTIHQANGRPRSGTLAVVGWSMCSVSTGWTHARLVRDERRTRMSIRIMPCLDMQNGRVVKGVRFVDIQDAGDPVACARAYCEAGATVLLAASVFHYSLIGIRELKDFLAGKGVSVA